MSNIQIKYQVESKENLELLEDAVKKLSKAYSLEGFGTAIASINIASELEKRSIIEINPDKNSQIKEVYSNVGSNQGKIIKSSPDMVYLTIDDASFFITYKQKD